METKGELYRCTRCLLFQPKSCFHKKNNKYGIRSICKTCRAIRRTERYNENKKQELEYGRLYKQNNPEKRRETSRKSAAKNLVAFRLLLNGIKNVACFDCKVKFAFCAMDFDHRDTTTKLFNISEAQSMNENVLMAEIAKCDVVCANCHRIREHNRRHIEIAYLNRLINEYKNVPCMDCKTPYPYYVMDFDHRDPTQKLFNISKPPSQKNKELIISEIMKCDVVCANCHRIRTFAKEAA